MLWKNFRKWGASCARARDRILASGKRDHYFHFFQMILLDSEPLFQTTVVHNCDESVSRTFRVACPRESIFARRDFNVIHETTRYFLLILHNE